MSGPALIICGGDGVYTRHIFWCPTESRRRRFVSYVDNPWYAPRLTCLGCGDSFDSEEGRCERPFARGWRPKAIAHAKKHWHDAVTQKEARDFLMARL